MGEPGRETLEERGGEGERERSGGYLSFSGAARKPSEILRLARFEDLSPLPPPSPLEKDTFRRGITRLSMYKSHPIYSIQSSARLTTLGQEEARS